jgi:hypothetical protein
MLGHVGLAHDIAENTFVIGNEFVVIGRMIFLVFWWFGAAIFIRNTTAAAGLHWSLHVYQLLNWS